MIEDILYKAEKLGIRQQVLDQVSLELKINPTHNRTPLYEIVFKKLKKQIKKS